MIEEHLAVGLELKVLQPIVIRACGLQCAGYGKGLIKGAVGIQARDFVDPAILVEPMDQKLSTPLKDRTLNRKAKTWSAVRRVNPVVLEVPDRFGRLDDVDFPSAVAQAVAVDR